MLSSYMRKIRKYYAEEYTNLYLGLFAWFLLHVVRELLRSGCRKRRQRVRQTPCKKCGGRRERLVKWAV